MKKTLHCMVCKARVEIGRTNSVQEMMDQSGWNPLMDGAGGLYWVCLNCGDEVGRMARRIKEILYPDRDTFLDFDALLRFKEVNAPNFKVGDKVKVRPGSGNGFAQEGVPLKVESIFPTCGMYLYRLEGVGGFFYDGIVEKA